MKLLTPLILCTLLTLSTTVNATNVNFCNETREVFEQAKDDLLYDLESNDNNLTAYGSTLAHDVRDNISLYMNHCDYMINSEAYNNLMGLKNAIETMLGMDY